MWIHALPPADLWPELVEQRPAPSVLPHTFLQPATHVRVGAGNENVVDCGTCVQTGTADRSDECPALQFGDLLSRANSPQRATDMASSGSMMSMRMPDLSLVPRLSLFAVPISMPYTSGRHALTISALSPWTPAFWRYAESVLPDAVGPRSGLARSGSAMRLCRLAAG